MDKQKLHRIVEKITRKIILELNQNVHMKKILFIFCETGAHEPFNDQFIELKNDDIIHDLLFLDGETSGWLGKHQIQSTGTNEVLAADINAPAPLELPIQYDAVVIPELDLDNAARVSLGLKGSVIAEIIFSSLQLNKPVIVGIDVPGIKRADRRTLGTLSLTSAYYNLFKKYQKEMQQLGIYFSEQASINHVIKELLTTSPSLNNSPKTFDKHLLTAHWLASNLSKDEQLHIKKETIITPLAKDFAKERNIEFRFF